MTELPEDTSFHTSCPPKRARLGEKTALRIGRDRIGYDVFVLDSGEVVGRLYDDVYWFNTSVAQFAESLALMSYALETPGHLTTRRTFARSNTRFAAPTR